MRISSPRDFWTGLIYVVLGAGAYWIALEYKIGTVGRMGPGYFPRVLAAILFFIGLVSLARAFVLKGEPIGHLAWKPLLMISGAIILYGVLVHKAGLVIALLALILVGAAASKEFDLHPKALAGMAALIAFCSAVFVKGLGLPIPLAGPWVKAILAPLGLNV